MKIAFTTSGSSLDAPLESRFGRAPNLLIYETENGTVEVIDNIRNMNAAQGAGIQSAEKVSRSGAAYLVTGHCGPKAFRVLKSAGVRVFTSSAATISGALEQFRSGELKEAQSADVDGHWA